MSNLPQASDMEVLGYIEWHNRIDALTDDELVRLFLKSNPVFGMQGELGEKICERLVPGIIEKMGDEAEATP